MERLDAPLGCRRLVEEALEDAPGDPHRLREIAATARAVLGGEPRIEETWLAEHEAKALLRARGLPVTRGRVVDEQALIEALGEGRIAGAGLDVYWEERPVVPSPNPNPALFELGNVILTPHIGGQTEESLTDIAVRAAANMVALVKGDRPEGLLNPEVLNT